MDINLRCGCKKEFNDNDTILLLIPCNHFIHNKCFINNRCLLCDKKTEKYLTEKQIKKSKFKTDIKAIKFVDNLIINYKIIPKQLLLFTSFVNKIFSLNSIYDIDNCIELLFNTCNLKINILDNTKKNKFVYDKTNKIIQWDNDVKQKVIISNHTNYLDGFVIYYLFKCGFVSSEFIKTIPIGKVLAEKDKLLIFKRGESTGMVDKIKDFLKKENCICIFPEGAISHNNTLLKFRTGAFYSADCICPIVVKYSIDFDDNDFTQMIMKVISQKEIIVDVIINDFEHAPFDNKRIEKIRHKMAKVGNLKITNVSNKFVVD